MVNINKNINFTKTNTMYPFTNPTGNMKVSQAMEMINLIKDDWHLKIHCLPEEGKMLSFGKSYRIVNRILKNSARNN